MFGGRCFVQRISVFTHCLVFWLHLHSCSSSSALPHLRLLSRPEPPSVLCLPWFCFTPRVCVHESWRRIELVKDESRKMQFDVRVPKVTKTSSRWQKFTFQGFQFSHFYQWTEMKTKVLSLLQDSNWPLYRSLLIRQCLKIPNWTEIKSKHLAPCTTSILGFPFHLLRLNFEHFCCSWYQVTISYKSLYLMKMINIPWQRRQVCYWVPKLD